MAEILHKEDKVYRIGYFSFLIGIFFLASAPLISVLLLLLAFTLNTIKGWRNILKDDWNKPLLVSSALLITSTIVHSLSYYEDNINWDSSLSWIGLFNWIPLFFCFGGAQAYLKNDNERRICSFVFISGTIPVLISGIGQYFFNWDGPWELFFGLIKWYQKPITPSTDNHGLSGLFSNANYTGAWLNIVWPFTIAAIFQANNFLKKTTIFSIFLGFSTCIFLTNSRAAWGCLLISLFIVIGTKILKYLIPLLIIVGTLIYSCIRPIFGIYMQNFFRSIIPERFWIKFSEEGYIALDGVPHITRLNIWESGWNYILSNQIFGSGAGSFPIKFFAETGVYRGHSHNIFLELAISYGLPVALIIFGFIVYLLTKRITNLKILDSTEQNKELLFEKAWFAATVSILLANLVDVQYFDLRISISFWILLGGIKNMKYPRALNFRNNKS